MPIPLRKKHTHTHEALDETRETMQTRFNTIQSQETPLGVECLSLSLSFRFKGGMVRKVDFFFSSVLLLEPRNDTPTRRGRLLSGNGSVPFFFHPSHEVFFFPILCRAPSRTRAPIDHGRGGGKWNKVGIPLPADWRWSAFYGGVLPAARCTSVSPETPPTRLGATTAST